MLTSFLAQTLHAATGVGRSQTVPYGHGLQGKLHQNQVVFIFCCFSFWLCAIAAEYKFLQNLGSLAEDCDHQMVVLYCQTDSNCNSLAV